MNQTLGTKPHLDLEVRLQNCTLTPERLEFLKSELGTIPHLVGKFAQPRLHLDIHKHPRQKDFHLKMSLNLGKDTLFTGDRHKDLMPAFNACVSKMIINLEKLEGRRLSKKRKAANSVWEDSEES